MWARLARKADKTASGEKTGGLYGVGYSWTSGAHDASSRISPVLALEKHASSDRFLGIGSDRPH